MGSCFSYCKSDSNRCAGLFFCTRNQGNKYFDTGSMLEFENLIGAEEQSECKQPTSIFTARERELLCSRQYDVLLSEQVAEDADVAKQQIRREEELELQEEVAMEARREAARMARLVQSPEIINPAKLPFGGHCRAWVASAKDVAMTDILVHQHPTRHLEKSVLSMQGRGNHQLRERAATVNSTPPSSIDLEWENEDGLTPPARTASVVTDDELTSMAITSTTSNPSHRSSPLSNGNDLEWDGDFSSTQMTDLDLETEQLISEIERMTSIALNETGPRRLSKSFMQLEEYLVTSNENKNSSHERRPTREYNCDS